METELKKILIVDDDTFLLDMYGLKFSKSNFSVTTALGPEQALEKLHQGLVPDVIILDIMMPVMDGFELLEKIKEEKLTPNSVVIFLSNRGQPSDVSRAEELGASGYIVKASSTPSEVIDQVAKIMEKAKK
jgi:CheY-like chemotaxis protein